MAAGAPGASEPTSSKIVLGEVDGVVFEVEPQTLITGRTGIIGASGSGKSNTIGVLCEELARLNFPFLLVDVEGGFHTLSERYQVAWVGNDPRANARHDPKTYDVIAQLIEEKGGRVVFDVSDRSDATDLVAAMLRALFQRADSLPENDRSGVLIVIDEVQQFIPQDQRVRVQEVLDISTRGRKRGLGLVLATQRPASVDKTALAQCDSQLIGLLSIANDKEAVRGFFASATGGRALLDKLPSLEQGRFFALGALSKIPELVHVRPRITTHEGATPQARPKPGFTASELGEALGGVGPPAPQAAGSSPSVPTYPPPPPYAPAGASAPPPARPLSARPSSAGVPSSSTPTGNVVLAVPFAVPPDQARQVLQKLMAGPANVHGIMNALNPLHARLSEESFDATYWPFLRCTVVAPQRHLLGKVDERTLRTAWDARFLGPVSFASPLQPRVVRPFDPDLLDLDWRQLKVLTELSRARRDMTAGDLVQATSKNPPTLKDAAVRAALAGLENRPPGKRPLVVRGTDVGRAKTYRPAVSLDPFDVESWDTAVPTPGSPPSGLAAVPLQEGQLRLAPLLWKDAPSTDPPDAFPRAVSLASLDGSSLAPPEVFYLPFYRAVYRAADPNAPPQVYLINGATGAGRKLDDREARLAVS